MKNYNILSPNIYIFFSFLMMHASPFPSPPVTVSGCVLAGKKGRDYKSISSPNSKFQNEKSPLNGLAARIMINTSHLTSKDYIFS